MAVTPSVTVDVSLQNPGVSRAGFSTMLVIGAHRWFEERVREYTSLSAAAEDIPTDSLEYAALSAAFSQKPGPASIKVGRREEDVSLSPSAPDTGDLYTVSVAVNGGDVVDVSYTALVTDTSAEDIVDAIKAVIDGDADVSVHITTTKVGTGAAATLEISPVTTGDFFSLSNLDNIGYSFTATETAQEVVEAIEAVDNDFSTLVSTDHTQAFVLAMSSVMETREKQYFVSLQDTGVLSAFSQTATDTGAILAQNQLRNTSSFFWHEADTKFPEAAFFAFNSGYDPGKIDYTNITLLGFGVSKNPTTGNVLSSTEQSYLAERNMSFIRSQVGNSVVYGGTAVDGTPIDEVRSLYFAPARLTEALASLLQSQQGTKIGYNNPGINQVRSVCKSTFNKFLSTDATPNMLNEFKFTFPRAEQADVADRQAGILRGTFEAYFTGAIKIIHITGTLSYKLG